MVFLYYLDQIDIYQMVKWVDEFYSHGEYANRPFYEALEFAFRFQQAAGSTLLEKYEDLQFKKIKPKGGLVSLFKPQFMKPWIEAYKKGGVKELLTQKGWKVIVAFFLFYLVRDSLLYIIIPWIGFKHFSSCF